MTRLRNDAQRGTKPARLHQRGARESALLAALVSLVVLVPLVLNLPPAGCGRTHTMCPDGVDDCQCDPGKGCHWCGDGLCDTDGITTFDFNYTYNIEAIDSSIQVGCINCFDEDPVDTHRGRCPGQIGMELPRAAGGVAEPAGELERVGRVEDHRRERTHDRQ